MRGSVQKNHVILKGRDTVAPSVVPPPQGFPAPAPEAQGVFLSWDVLGLWLPAPALRKEHDRL